MALSEARSTDNGTSTLVHFVTICETVETMAVPVRMSEVRWERQPRPVMLRHTVRRFRWLGLCSSLHCMVPLSFEPFPVTIYLYAC
jgi:hypothetical protein